MGSVNRMYVRWTWPVVGLGLFLQGCGADNSVRSEADTARMPPSPETVQTVSAETLGRLRVAVERAEDLSAIKRLQKAYGYYLDKGLWTDLLEFFSEDAVASYPAGTYIGRDSLREHLYRNVGAVQVGQVGLGDGRLYNHINMQPVVHLDADGDTARGRWRAMAMFGRWGDASGGMWAEGVYNMRYRKEDGVWKIAGLDYHSGFGAPYNEGWGANPDAEPRRSGARQLPHPADRPRERDCDGFPQACLIPFDFDNLGTSADAQAWHLPAQSEAWPVDDPAQALAELQERAQRLKDETELENLQRIYGYYLDRAQWRQLADLFSRDATVEIGQMGIYRGPARIREFFAVAGPAGERTPSTQRQDDGLVDGWLYDHVQLQTLVTVAPDGQQAAARSREWGMTGEHGGEAFWHDGVYENRFVKEDGVWKIQALRYYPTYITAYAQGWTRDARPVPGPLEHLPADAPPTEVYEIFPKAHVPPFHYAHPVTGQAPTYPEVGGPGQASIAAVTLALPAHRPPPVSDPEATVVNIERLLQAVKDHHEIENLENAYGYYLDKNLWNELADLFAEGGSMELAQRGPYIGRERVREFLFTVFGDEGPVPGRLGNHLHMQPVIHVSEDGQRAQVRSRMMQQLGFNGRPSLGSAIYQNRLVKEEGRWKFASTHAFNTFTASYVDGWAKSEYRGVPGPSERLPPDAPATVVFDMFPTVYEIPFHYANPVTGRE